MPQGKSDDKDVKRVTVHETEKTLKDLEPNTGKNRIIKLYQVTILLISQEHRSVDLESLFIESLVRSLIGLPRD